jgi:hypothetical protein
MMAAPLAQRTPDMTLKVDAIAAQIQQLAAVRLRYACIPNQHYKPRHARLAAVKVQPDGEFRNGFSGETKPPFIAGASPEKRSFSLRSSDAMLQSTIIKDDASKKT